MPCLSPNEVYPRHYRDHSLMIMMSDRSGVEVIILLFQIISTIITTTTTTKYKTLCIRMWTHYLKVVYVEQATTKSTIKL